MNYMLLFTFSFLFRLYCANKICRQSSFDSMSITHSVYVRASESSLFHRPLYGQFVMYSTAGTDRRAQPLQSPAGRL